MRNEILLPHHHHLIITPILKPIHRHHLCVISSIIVKFPRETRQFSQQHETGTQKLFNSSLSYFTEHQSRLKLFSRKIPNPDKRRFRLPLSADLTKSLMFSFHCTRNLFLLEITEMECFL